MIKQWLPHLLVACIVLASVGCKKEQQGAATPVRQLGAELRVGETGMSRQDRGIMILPDLPNATTDLQVLVSNLNGFTVRWEKNGSILDGERDQKLAKDKFVKGDRITAAAVAGNREVAATVTIGNAPPSVISASLSPQFIYRGVDITALPVGQDADGDTIRYTYLWTINGQDRGEHSDVLKGDRFVKSDKVAVTIVPSDGESSGEAFISAPIMIPNAPPRFVSTPVLQFSGTVYEYMVRANDPDDETVTYSLAQSPQGMTIDSSSGRISWQVTSADGGSHTIEVLAQDPAGATAFQKYVLTITIPGEGQQ